MKNSSRLALTALGFFLGACATQGKAVQPSTDEDGKKILSEFLNEFDRGSSASPAADSNDGNSKEEVSANRGRGRGPVFPEISPENISRDDASEEPHEVTKANKSYLIPALEIVGFEFLLNQYDRNVIDEDVYGSSLSSFGKNLQSSWIYDEDNFTTNQFAHPYAGSIYYGFARSAGLNYWESLGYTFAGSFLWETAGETGRPSINDQFATGIGGSFLGEPLFRMANWILDRGGDKPSFSRELAAAVISPSNAVNRHAFGERFRGGFASKEPAVYHRLRVGTDIATQVSGETVDNFVRRERVLADFSFDYGLPGKPGYTYDRPFDYFQFAVGFITHSASTLDNLSARGLLYGEDYQAGDDYRGVWGIYGSFNFVAAEIFQVSTTAVALGTTGQWWVSENVALQGTVMTGLGYGAASSIGDSGVTALSVPDQHYGVTPQAFLALRLIFGDVAMIDLSGREYYISGIASEDPGDNQTVNRAQISFVLRVYERQAIEIQYVGAHRDGNYRHQPDVHQDVGSIGIYYNFLNDAHFGAVEWREKKPRG